MLKRLSTDWGCSADELEIIHAYEPHVPWQQPYLERRARCYEQGRLPGSAAAARDLQKFLAAAPKRLTGGMPIQ